MSKIKKYYPGTDMKLAMEMRKLIIGDDKNMDNLFYGRALLNEEINYYLKGKERPASLQSFSAFREGQCQRCGSTSLEDRAAIPCHCGDSCYYCTTCLQMGQIKSCSKLWYLPEENEFNTLAEPILTWQGELSDQQNIASQEIVGAVQKKEKRLIWAVAGAGKTEMLFEGIATALKGGQRVCVASPRIDVCLELAPRLQEAFANVSQIVLYGEMEEDYHYTQLVIATTHQLLRFQAAFDVLIIDEIDAFPYYQNDALYYATEKARKPKSTLIYLTATPDRYLQKQVAKGTLAASILPARYHGYPLPVPKLVWAGNWRRNLVQASSRSPIISYIRNLLAAKRRFLVFIPHIEWMLLFEKRLAVLFPESRFTSVSSLDEQRKEKVIAMRKGSLDFLLTTTILERGVTFQNIDVLVIGAEDRTFTEAALVQIAGRAGRSADYPRGDVRFFHYGKSLAMKAAVKQIKRMNQKAKERGLLHG